MDAVGFAIVTPVSLSTEKGVYKGMPVESWDQRPARRASLAPPRKSAGGLGSRGRSLQVSVGAPQMTVDLPLGTTPAHVTEFFRDDSSSSRSRRRRRRHSEHPHLRRRDDSAENRPALPAAAVLPPPRPPREPTLNLHDLEDDASSSRRARRWADTPGAASVAAWVREQQVQAQFQFAPLSPPPTPRAQTGSGFLGKVKKLIGKPGRGE